MEDTNIKKGTVGIATGDDFKGGKVRREKTVVELFKLPPSSKVSFLPSTKTPLRRVGNRRAKQYSEGEQRRKAERRARRERERLVTNLPEESNEAKRA